MEHRTNMCANIDKRKEALEEYIRKNPHSSTVEREQLEEIEEEERKKGSETGEVQF